MDNTTAPKVFVSYSKDSNDHIKWVEKLATDLRACGVDALLDNWDTRAGDDIPLFMETSSQANLILCVITDNYVERANERKRGVGYETSIISAIILSGANKCIPIKRNSGENNMPELLKTKKYIDFSNDNKYKDSLKELLDRIYNKDIEKKPPLGKNPYENSDISTEISVETTVEKLGYYNDSTSGNVSFDYSNNDGNFVIGKGNYRFVTHWSRAGQGRIHCYRDKVKRLGVNSEYTEFPPKTDIPRFNFSSRNRMIKEGEIVILENEFDNYVAIKVTKVICNTSDINHLLEFEYKIYDVLSLLSTKKVGDY